MARLKAALLLALLLLSPIGAAQSLGPSVRLVAANGTWNGESASPAQPGAWVDLWVPPTARLHAVVGVTPAGEVPASWRADGADLLQVQAPPNATRLVASFDFRGGSPVLATIRAAPGTALTIVPPAGQAVESDDASFAQAPDGSWSATAQGSVALRVVDADRVGELPLLLTLGLVTLLSFLLVWAWHKLRPPLEGRRAERFLDHLAELQARLLPVVLVFAFLNFAYFAGGLREVTWRGWPLVAPTFSVDGSIAARAFASFAERLVPPDVQLVVLRPADAVLAQVQMTLFLAFVSVLPALLYEIARFVGPALRAKERRLALRVVPLVLVLFGAGCAFGFLAMAPLMIRTLYDFAPSIGAAPLLGVGDLMSFSLLVIVAFGLAFELPVAMYVLARLGFVKASTFRRYLRHAIVVIVIGAGVVTPDPSVVSQLLVAVPVTTLYLVGMLAASFAERRRAAASPG